jgi:hypothetical protein
MGSFLLLLCLPVRSVHLVVHFATVPVTTTSSHDGADCKKIELMQNLSTAVFFSSLHRLAEMSALSLDLALF